MPYNDIMYQIVIAKISDQQSAVFEDTTHFDSHVYVYLLFELGA